MKKIISVFMLMLIVSVSSGQITLTSSNNPVNGDRDHYRTCDTTNITPGNSGANQSWNYTALTLQDSSTVTFVNASTTPFAAQFPTSNIASTNDKFAYNYFTTSSSNILINGTGENGLVVVFSDPQLFMQYPFTYNSSATDNFAAHYTSGSLETFRTGTTTITGDAWGTITLPSGTYQNSLRLKYVIVTKDSTNMGTTLTTTLTSYNWFIPGKKFPVFEIIYLNFAINGFPFGNDKVVNYSTNVPIGITNLSSETPSGYSLSQNYPNPFNPSTNLEFGLPAEASAQAGISNLGFVSLKVYDMLGKEVEVLVNEQLQPGMYRIKWNAARLPSGTYFYRLSSGAFSETKKLNLVK